MPRPKSSPTTALRTGRLKAADPFELIRWLARSQPDPRKALAELVQNSLDAGSRSIRITRLRKGGVAELRILDDGEGVIPELGREEALTYLATHIGHSRKRELTPEQRRELMLQGKYGIGLLGFWSIGRVLEIRTQVTGQEALLLRLHEESPAYEIERVRGRLPLDGEQWTEVVVKDLHRQAFASLAARRAADYLGSELRGQLLAHQAQVLIYDGIARGRATKVVEVQPRRFDGERLAIPDSFPVAHHSPLSVELYLLAPGSTDAGKVALSQAGTVVYEDIADFSVADFARPPWNEPRLCGVIDFPDFQVPPGTRRAVVLDDAAAAFLEAVRALETMIAEQLAMDQEKARAELESGLMRQLERAFRDVSRHAPVYDFFDVLDERRSRFAPDAGGEQGAGASSAATNGIVLPGGAALDSNSDSESGEEQEIQMTMAGRLAAAAILPAATKVERLGQRRFRVQAYDAAGLRIQRPLIVQWQVDPGVGRLEVAGATSAKFEAGPDPVNGTIIATVTEAGATVEAQASVEVFEELVGSEAARSGIPEPVFIEDPSSPWRSRVAGKIWEVNSGHDDYRQASETPRRKLRYLAALLAKEVVLHSFPAPSLAPALERMVEVLTITERRLERG